MAYLLDNTQNNTNNSGQQDQLMNNGVPQTGGGASAPSGQGTQNNTNPTISSGQGLQNSSNSLPARQGSGRFTNLQQYIGANQGAGSNISSSVQKNVNNQVSQNKQQATNDTNTGQSNVTSGNALIAQGQNFQNQMSNPNFTPDQATQFAQNQGNVQAVNKLETGTAVDTGALNQQNQQALNSTAQYQQQAQQLQQLGQTGQGQQQLLNQTYGGQYKPVYGQGQSMLDSLLLQGTPGSLGNLQNAISGINTNANQLSNNVAGQTSAIQNLGTQQTNLGQQLQNTTNQNVNNFENTLQGQVGTQNAALDAQQKAGSQFLDYNNQALSDADFQTKYGVSKSAYGGNQDLFNQMGLKQGEQTFNVFNNPDLNLGSVATINSQRAQNWQDVANQQNVNQYQALAQLANTNADNYALTKAGNEPTSAYTLNTGANSLQGQIDSAKQSFLNYIQNNNAQAQNQYVQGVKGVASVNLGNLVNDYSNIYNSGDLGMQYTRNGSDMWGNSAAAYNPALSPGYVPPAASGAPAVVPGTQTRIDAMNSAAQNDGAVNQLAGPGMKTAGSYIGGTVGSALGPVGTVAGSVLGGIVGNAAHSIVSPLINNISNTLTGNSGDDIGKGEWWGQHQTEGRNQDQFNSSQLAKNALNQLNAQGFGNYITSGGGVQTAALQKLSDLGNFGYGQQAPTGGLSLGATTVPTNLQGIYNVPTSKMGLGPMIIPGQTEGT